MKYPIRQYRQRRIPSDAEAYWIQTLYHAAGLSFAEIAELYRIAPLEVRQIIRCTQRWKHLRRHNLKTLFAWRVSFLAIDNFADIPGVTS